MMQMIKRSILAAGLLAVPAAAQEQAKGLTLGLSYIGDVQNGGSGLGVDLAYTLVPSRLELPVRFGVGVNGFFTTCDATTDAKLSNDQAYVDLFFTKPGSALAFYGGLSVNQWQVSANGRSSTVSGLKLGLRAGMEYRFASAASLSVGYQVAEAGTSSELLPNGPKDTGARGLNPSWLQVGVRFHF